MGWNMKLTSKNNYFKLSLILVIITIGIALFGYVLVAYAGGPRLDYDEAYTNVPGAPECWVDGYDAGFAGKYDKDRAGKCNEIEGDQYNTAWGYGCKYAGYIEQECNDIKEGNDSINYDSLKEEITGKCWDDGYEDGRNNPFDHDRNRGCDDYGSSYYEGFIAGCVSVEGYTKETCESATDAS
ncbi:MAG: hypothetical protein WBP83_13535 [Nitrososphaeraceae archaeon]|jgi:hypothetical protein